MRDEDADLDGDAVLLTIEGEIAHITFNRPASLNAMNLPMMTALDEVVERALADTDVRMVLLQGKGRAFCAGLDLEMMGREGMPPGFYEHQESALRKLELSDKLSVAVIQGHCLGGGVQMAAACDIRIAVADAQLALPAVNEGLFPGLAPFRLPRLIGLGPAKRLVLSGQTLSANEALAIGLVDEVIAVEGFEQQLDAALEPYLRAPSGVVAATKRLGRRAYESDLDAAYAESLPMMAECLRSDAVAVAKEQWRARQEARQEARQGTR